MATKTANQRTKPILTLLSLAVALGILIAVMVSQHVYAPRLGLDLSGGTTVTLTASNSGGEGSVSAESLEQARDVIEQRVNSLGVGETSVTTSGGNQIIVSVPNVNQDDLVALVGQTAFLTFRGVYAAQQQEGAPPLPAPTTFPSAQPTSAPDVDFTPNPQYQRIPSPANGIDRPTVEGAPGSVQPAQALDWAPDQQLIQQFSQWTCGSEFPEVTDQPLFACDGQGTKFLLTPTLIKGTDVSDAAAIAPDQSNGFQWIVSLNFTPQGGQQFQNATGQLATKQEPQNRFAIVLDQTVVSDPSVSQVIAGTTAQIEGVGDQQTASELARVLKYGALPLAFEVSSVDNVSATLGSEQLNAGLVAGTIGLALVILFCFIYYRGLGLVVVSSLAVAGAFTYALLVLLGAVPGIGFALNLPGIAGAIVAIATTADSFVIYFERIRDEVREGRTLRSAIETGWIKARQTILISDAVSLLSALILFFLAIGAVRGFAFTLGLTTIIDMVVVFFFTKPLMSLLGRTKFFGQGHRLSGLAPDHLGTSHIPGKSLSEVRARKQPQSVETESDNEKKLAPTDHGRG